MSLDSLGKKTHLPNVLRLFEHVDDIWPAPHPIDLREAAHELSDSQILKGLRRLGIPSDVRVQQAYVKRFFRFLQLPKTERSRYPTVILSGADSVALRQCLYLDWAFNTSEAPDALRGLNAALDKAPTFELSPSSHRKFCRWISVDPDKDNTRRGPFARWLEDVGLAAPVPDRGAHETSVLVSKATANTVCPEAFVYGLMLEFCVDAESTRVRPAEIPADRIAGSQTVQALLLPAAEINKLARIAASKEYVTLTKSTLRLDPKVFAQKLAMTAPWPSADWFDDTVSVDTTINPELASKAIHFPPDDCPPMDGVPFEAKPKMTTTTAERRQRDNLFRKRVGAAYKYTCAVTGTKLRSPYATRFYGHAAHIVPHSGVDKGGNSVYGKDAVSNGVYLDGFLHWCFDAGWITLEPIIKRKSIETYQIKVATIAAEDAFERELDHFTPIDGKRIDIHRLPYNPANWPNVTALNWHRDNVFADSRL